MTNCPTCRQPIPEPLVIQVVNHRQCSCGEEGTIKQRTRINNQGVKHVYYICRGCQAARQRTYYKRNRDKIKQSHIDKKTRTHMVGLGQINNQRLINKYA